MSGRCVLGSIRQRVGVRGRSYSGFTWLEPTTQLSRYFRRVDSEQQACVLTLVAKDSRKMIIFVESIEEEKKKERRKGKERTEARVDKGKSQLG